MINLSIHFTLKEFVHSNIAEINGINNDPPKPGVLNNLFLTAKKMEQVRTALEDNPIKITSGYRCAALNTLVGGSKNSAHMQGLAVDFICPKYGTPEDIYNLLSQFPVKYDQLILEHGDWVHISFDPKMRGEHFVNP